MDQLDLEAYSGIWYETAKNNAYYAPNCDSAIAEYRISDVGLKIVNTCYSLNATGPSSFPQFPELRNGDSIHGVALPTKVNNIFQIKFETGNVGKYQILYTNYDDFSIIGDVKTQYVSVLCRRPLTSSGEKALLRRLLTALGFKTFTWTYNAENSS